MAAFTKTKLEFDLVKEWHFHVYFDFENEEQVAIAKAFSDKIVSAVVAEKFVVVCEGVTKDILPQLEQNESSLDFFQTRFWMKPAGPHTVGSFGVWVPIEHFVPFVSFLYAHRPHSLSILIHPIHPLDNGTNEADAHTVDAMWFGERLPIRMDVLSTTGGPNPQNPELGLGYSGK